MQITINDLMKTIELPLEVQEYINKLEKDNVTFKFFEDINNLNSIFDAKDAYHKIKKEIGYDKDGFIMLDCYLHAALNAYVIYRENEFPENVYIDTMKCFTRFVNEYKNSYGHYGFDRGWWTYRQTSFVLYRLGALEYEIQEIGKENKKIVYMHIPSDCELTLSNIKKSLSDKNKFFSKFWEDFLDAPIYCESWLLSKELSLLIPASSRILQFQKLFTISSYKYDSDEYIIWIFGKPYQNFNELPEKTTLQKNMKKYLLEGGKISTGVGQLRIAI